MQFERRTVASIGAARCATSDPTSVPGTGSVRIAGNPPKTPEGCRQRLLSVEILLMSDAAEEM